MGIVGDTEALMECEWWEWSREIVNGCGGEDEEDGDGGFSPFDSENKRIPLMIYCYICNVRSSVQWPVTRKKL